MKMTALAYRLGFAAGRFTLFSAFGLPDVGLLVDLADGLTVIFSGFPQFDAIVDVVFDSVLVDGSDGVVHTQTDNSNTCASDDLGRIDMLIDATNNYIAEVNGVPKTDACTSSATQAVDCETEIPDSDASGNSPGIVSLSADVMNILDVINIHEVADGKKTEDCTSTTTNENSPVNLKRQISQILKNYGKDKKRGAHNLLEILARQKKRKQKRRPIIVVGPQFVKPNVMDLSITLTRNVVKKKIIVTDVNNNFMMKVRTRIRNMNHRILSDNEGNPLVLIKNEDIGAHLGWHVFMGEKDVPENLLYQLEKSSNSGFQVFLAENKKLEVCNFMIKKINNAGTYSIYVGDSDDTIAQENIDVGRMFLLCCVVRRTKTE